MEDSQLLSLRSELRPASRIPKREASEPNIEGKNIKVVQRGSVQDLARTVQENTAGAKHRAAGQIGRGMPLCCAVCKVLGL